MTGSVHGWLRLWVGLQSLGSLLSLQSMGSQWWRVPWSGLGIMEMSGASPTHYLKGNDSARLNLATWFPILGLPVHCRKPTRYPHISCLSFRASSSERLRRGTFPKLTQKRCCLPMLFNAPFLSKLELKVSLEEISPVNCFLEATHPTHFPGLALLSWFEINKWCVGEYDQYSMPVGKSTDWILSFPHNICIELSEIAYFPGDCKGCKEEIIFSGGTIFLMVSINCYCIGNSQLTGRCR